ncbi:MAG TPA: M23 family metallopeptidase [bacterium]|nr:M23 family metallopeptidase [bacterium]
MARVRLPRFLWIINLLIMLIAAGTARAVTAGDGDTASPAPAAPAAPETAPAKPEPAPQTAFPPGFEFKILPTDQEGAVNIAQGQAFLVRIDDPGRVLASARARWDEQVIPCLPGTERQKWIGIGGVGKDQKPGSYTLSLTVETTAGKRIKSQKSFTVVKTEFPATQLSVDPRMVKVPPDLQKKVKADHKAFAAVWASPAYARLWDGPFLRPVAGRITAPYGERRVYNNQLNGQHGGVDLAGPVGEPVLASASGKVVLVHESYLEGNTIVLDHGGGLFTYYCHLSAFKVETGQMVKAGDVIALVGQTGRVTGPHLHFGVRVQGVKVDGMSLLDLSQWLGEN